MKSVKPNSDSSLRWPIAACALAAFGLLFPLPSFVELYNEPAGSSVRPMGQAALIFLAGIGTPIVVVILLLATDTIFKPGASRWLSVLAIVLAAIPFPAYVLLFRWIVDSHRLVLKP